MNLNPWYRVLVRRVTRAVRRAFFSFDTPTRRRLYAAKMAIAMNEELTDVQKVELARINHILGNGSVYRFTPEQRALQAKMAADVMQRLRDQPNPCGPTR